MSPILFSSTTAGYGRPGRDPDPWLAVLILLMMLVIVLLPLAIAL